jgi:hypothetical protein
MPIYDFQIQQHAYMPLVARTVVLNLFHNFVKQVYANPTGREHEVFSFCSMDKCLVTWNAGKVAETCRERSGG